MPLSPAGIPDIPRGFAEASSWQSVDYGANRTSYLSNNPEYSGISNDVYGVGEGPPPKMRASVDGALQGDDDEDEDEDEVELLYDSALNCYYDPRTNQYYELDA